MVLARILLISLHGLLVVDQSYRSSASMVKSSFVDYDIYLSFSSYLRMIFDYILLYMVPLEDHTAVLTKSCILSFGMVSL